MATLAQQIQDIKREIYDIQVQQKESMTPLERQIHDIKNEKLQGMLKWLYDLEQVIENQKPNLEQDHMAPSPRQQDISSKCPSNR